MKKIYLDYAATTPVDPRVLEAMMPYFCDNFGNTMSLHSFGQKAQMVLDESRKTVANFIGAKPEEIIFTSSATESNNFALKGIAFANEKKGNHIIISAIEHACIMESAKWLGGRGFKITYVPVDRFGVVNVDDVSKAITKETILISVMHVNNELGSIQPIAEIGQIAKENNIYFHSDCAQSLGKIPVNVNDLNVDLLTASGHKIYGPKGIGILFVKRGVKIEPLLNGGGQELGLRSSTSNVAGAVGFAKALELFNQEEKIAELREYLCSGVLSIPGSRLNSPKTGVPGILNFSFSGVEGEAITMRLDMDGIAVSTGSACSSNKLTASHVLLATGMKPEEAHGSLRVSIGRWTTKEDIDYFIESLFKNINQLREISPFKNV
ncbi:MAG: Cysteine desulfurase [Parcubacteria group bacterium ADurb.Bin247]|jgi:cysteine desulfurase|nr:MAG: Cysteine desulfurase [Parcubacteria group bacterium ADurb.Bin247]